MYKVTKSPNKTYSAYYQHIGGRQLGWIRSSNFINIRRLRPQCFVPVEHIEEARMLIAITGDLECLKGHVYDTQL